MLRTSRCYEKEPVWPPGKHNRNSWFKKCVMSASMKGVVVEAITIAGLPMNIGCRGMPIEAFAGPGGRDFDRRIILVGQTVHVTVRNEGTERGVVSAGFVCDELNPYVFQKAVENIALESTTDLSEYGPYASAMDRHVLEEAVRVVESA